MGNLASIEGSLSEVKVIMRIMRVLIVKSICQAAMGRVPILECLLQGARGRPWLRPVMPDVKGRCSPRTQL
jgi:hypothetical protein